MILFKKASDLSNYIKQQKRKSAFIGFVPTMGALHQGHLSLLQSSKKEEGLTICSIFVNPTQFNNADDFANYPVTIEKDIELLITAGCDVLFLPSEKEIYPADYQEKHFALGELEYILEGKYRPGHFQGVCQVVNRLLEIVNPHQFYLGAKDYQQCMVIQKLLELTSRRETHLIVSPTVRENDGLAMSSRNLRLSAAQRDLAPSLYNALQFIKLNFVYNHLTQLKGEAIKKLEAKGFKVDYLEIVDGETLTPSINNSGGKIALVAAYLGDVRLIDNLILN